MSNLKSSRPGTNNRIPHGKVICNKLGKYKANVMKVDDRRELIDKVGDAGFILFNYYFSLQGPMNVVITDKSAGNAIGWSERKTGEVRKKLERADLYHVEKTPPNKNGVSAIFYYIGSRDVELAKKRSSKATIPPIPSFDNPALKQQVMSQLVLEDECDLLRNIEEASTLYEKLERRMLERKSISNTLKQSLL